MSILVSEEHFRQNLLAMERENTELKTQVLELEGKLGNVNTDTTKMQRRIRSLEKTNDVLTKTTTSIEQQKRMLEKEVG